MELWEKIVATYPELAKNDFAQLGIMGSISLQDDGDGNGAYIRNWEYSQPIPTGLKIGKPKS